MTFNETTKKETVVGVESDNDNPLDGPINEVKQNEPQNENGFVEKDVDIKNYELKDQKSKLDEVKLRMETEMQNCNLIKNNFTQNFQDNISKMEQTFKSCL